MTDPGVFIFSPESNVEKAKGTVQSLHEEHSVDARGKLTDFIGLNQCQFKKQILRKIQLQVKAMKSVVLSQATDKAGAPWYHKEGHVCNFTRLGKEIKNLIGEGLGSENSKGLPWLQKKSTEIMDLFHLKPV